MAVYVDDFHTPARVGGLTARWSHLIADSRDELHAFAERLGLRREWFQDPVINGKPPRPQPGSRAAEGWHYDVTESKRREALQLGAKAISWLDLHQVIEARLQRTLYAWVSSDEDGDGGVHVVGIHHLPTARPVAERFIEATGYVDAPADELLAGEPVRRWAMVRPVDRGEELYEWVEGPGDGAVPVLTWYP
jgi:hypothetical protein